MKKLVLIVMIFITIIVGVNITLAQDYSSIIKSAQPLTPTKTEKEAKQALLSEKNWFLSYKTYNEGGKHFAIPVYMPGYRAYDVNKRNCLTDINTGKDENMMEVFLKESNAVQIPFISNPMSKAEICNYINSALNIGAKPENTTHIYRYKKNYFVEANCQIGDVYYRIWLDNSGSILAFKTSGEINNNKDNIASPKYCLSKAAEFVNKFNKYKLSSPVFLVENGRFAVRYYQKYNGITYYDNYIKVEFDKYGNITEYLGISPDVEFVNTDNIMDKKTIIENIVSFMPVKLDYYYIDRYDYNSVDNSPNVKNVSMKYSINNYTVNGKTGKLIDKNGNVVR